MTEPTRVLTYSDANTLAEILRGVDRKSKLRVYPRGAMDADHPGTYVMRALTKDGGGFWLDRDGDIRDATVWCSGITEQWIKVEYLIRALQNLDGHLGDTNPIATIDE